MPPKSKRGGKAAALPPPTKEDTEIDIRLAEIDLKVDDLKAELESALEGTISEMTRIIEAALLRMPAKIKAMGVKEFLTSFGGKTSLVIERDRKEMRLARTVARGGGGPISLASLIPTSTYAGRMGTVMKPGQKLARLAEMSGEGEGEETGGHAPASKVARADGMMAVKTPMVMKSRGVGVGVYPLPTPSLYTMKSSITTPAHFNPMLPKTPAGGMARRPRRGEVLFAISANGSPIATDALAAPAPLGTTAAAGVAHDSVVVKGSGGTMPMLSAGPGVIPPGVDIVLETGDGVTDEAAAARVVQEHGVGVLESAIEAMQAKLEALKAAAAKAKAEAGTTHAAPSGHGHHHHRHAMPHGHGHASAPVTAPVAAGIR